MNKINEALDYFLMYIFCPDKRVKKAREYWKKFKRVRDSMNPKEFEQLRAIFRE